MALAIKYDGPIVAVTDATSGVPIVGFSRLTVHFVPGNKRLVGEIYIDGRVKTVDIESIGPLPKAKESPKKPRGWFS